MIPGKAGAAAAAIVLGLVLATPARAGDDRPLAQPFDQRVEELAREGAERLKQAFERFLERMPRYGAPRTTPEGDIIIPRRRPLPGAVLPPDEPVET